MAKKKNTPSPVEDAPEVVPGVLDEALGAVDVGDSVDLAYCRNLRNYISERLQGASVEVYVREEKFLELRVAMDGKVWTRVFAFAD